MLRLPTVVVASTLVLLATDAAMAQALTDPRTGVPLPNSQAAAVDDNTALLVNPAGLAWVNGMELGLGEYSRLGSWVQHDIDAQTVFGGGGAAVALGGGLTLRDGYGPRLRGTLGAAIAADKLLSLGAALHALQPVSGRGNPDLLLDLGAQLRPARWLGLAVAAEGLGDQDTRPAALRTGLSLRPLGELITLGLDARLVPGHRDISNASYYGNATVEPGAALRLDLGGFAISAGANVTNLSAVSVAQPQVEALLGVQFNGEHVGVDALGGVGGILSPTLEPSVGVRVRGSSAEWPSLFAGDNRWRALTLTGDGIPAGRPEGIIAELVGGPDATAVLGVLDGAADDPRVEGIVLRLRGLSIGWGRAAELRAAIMKLRAAGKKVVVHMHQGDDLDAYVASAADKVFLTPSGALDVNGLRAEMIYVHDLLSNLGIQAEAVHAGRYKSAPRMFTASEPSPEELEVENALLDGVFDALVRGLAEGRGLSQDEVKALIDRGGLSAAQAAEARLVDGVAYDDEIEARVADFVGHNVRLEEETYSVAQKDTRWDEPSRIALIPIVGNIMLGRGEGGFGLLGTNAGSDDIVDAINDAAEDDGIKAIVLRIDSPGGDALASDLMWRAVMKAREKKPVIASMGDVAASGGYYVAAGANEIWAEPNTITGSIGVFGLLFNAQDLTNAAGVRMHSVERGALPGPSVFTPMSDAQRAAMQNAIDGIYESFLNAVITGRGEKSGLTKEQLRGLAEGHVWTGAQALDNKLVDQQGGMVEAIGAAIAAAHIDADEPVTVEVHTGRKDGLGGLMGLASVMGKDERLALRRAAAMLLGDVDSAAFLLEEGQRPLAVLPYTVRVR